jgi:hypothetical protein
MAATAIAGPTTVATAGPIRRLRIRQRALRWRLVRVLHIANHLRIFVRDVIIQSERVVFHNYRFPISRTFSVTASRISATSFELRTCSPSKLRSRMPRSTSKASRSVRSRSIKRDLSPSASARKRRASISRTLPINGRNAMCAKISRSISTPGATSASSNPPSVNRNTQRSVT